MSKLAVSQIRSGEGWILTQLSNVGTEVIPSAMPDILDGSLLVASEAFETWTPPGGEQLEAHLYAFSGDFFDHTHPNATLRSGGDAHIPSRTGSSVSYAPLRP